jgi:hypothetical protein
MKQKSNAVEEYWEECGWQQYSLSTIITTESLPIQNQSNFYFYVLVIAFIKLQILMGPQSKKA